VTEPWDAAAPALLDDCADDVGADQRPPQAPAGHRPTSADPVTNGVLESSHASGNRPPARRKDQQFLAV
jgi:hypothetical protein